MLKGSDEYIGSSANSSFFFHGHVHLWHREECYRLELIILVGSNNFNSYNSFDMVS